MTAQDPFDTHDDRTVIRPRPGGRSSGASQRGSPAYSRSGPDSAPLEELYAGASLNPLVGAAAPLLGLVAQLRQTASHADPDGLQEQVANQLKTFEGVAREQGIDGETVNRARYVLCAVVDEAALNTPWGSESSWGHHTLLSRFHNETWGGEKFFKLLDYLWQDPRGNQALLELMYVCLALGFRGRYSLDARGESELHTLQQRLYQTLRDIRGSHERELSPRWQGATNRSNPIVRYVPLWVVSTVALAIMILAYAGFNFRLNGLSDRALPAIHALGQDLSVPAATDRSTPAPPPATPDRPDLRELLRGPIKRGRLAILDQQDGSQTIRIQGDGLFPSGSAKVKAAFEPLLRRIGQALQQVPGNVLISGHTDDVPIHTLRFPSNWHLSKARADSVREILADVTGTPERFDAEGFAATEPLVPNDSPANRARNRRVEITVRPTST